MSMRAFLTARSQELDNQNAARRLDIAERNAASQEAWYGLKRDELERDIQMDEAAQRKQARADIVAGELMRAGTSEERDRIGSALMALSPDTYKSTMDIMNTRRQMGEAEMAQADEMLAQSWGIIRQMPEGAEKQQAMAVLEKQAFDMGRITQEELNNFGIIYEDDPQVAYGVLDETFGITDSSERLPAGGVVDYIGPNGTRRTFDLTLAEDREFLRKNRGWRKAPSEQKVGTPDEFQGRATDEAKFNEIEIGTMNALDTIDNALTMLEDNPEAFTQTGTLSRIGTGLVTELQTLGALATGDADVLDLENSAYQGEFKKAGVKSAEAKNLIFSMALAYAGAMNLGTGRALSDKDLQFAIQQVSGGDYATPEARQAVMEQVRRTMVDNFKNRYYIWHGNKEYTGDLGGKMNRRAGGGSTDNSGAEDAVTVNSKEERDALPSGTLYRLPDGRLMRKK